MSGQVDLNNPKRFNFNLRWIPEKSDDGQIFFSWKYWATNNIGLGLDYRPKTNNATFSGTWRLFSETEQHPAIILGTSTDDFEDQITSESVYITASKKLLDWQGVSVSPYIGATYIFEFDKLRPIGGVSFRKDRYSALFLYSGTDPHMTLSYGLMDGHLVSFVLWGMELPGMAYTMHF